MNSPESWIGSLIQKREMLDSSGVMHWKFLYAHKELGIERDHLHGRILVAGGADGQIEQSLFCSVESRFREPYGNVQSIWATDSSNVLMASHRYTYPFHIGVSLSIDESLSIDKGVVSFPYDLQDLLPVCPDNTFDVIMFFGIPNFVDQLDEELLSLVQKKLTRDGVFMGSGGRHRGDYNKEYSLDVCKKLIDVQKFKIISALKLDDWGHSASPAIDRIGLLLQKS